MAGCRRVLSFLLAGALVLLPASDAATRDDKASLMKRFLDMSKNEIAKDKKLELDEEKAAARQMELAASRVRIARTTQLPMTNLHWGHSYLKAEYGDSWNKPGGYWNGCDHMFKSLCHGRNDMVEWWEQNGWSDANAKLQKAAELDEDRQKMFREALKELHKKILEERQTKEAAKLARQEYLNSTRYDLALKEKKKKLLLDSERKDVIANLAKSSAIINAGLVHSIANNTDLAYASYGDVEAQAAQEEMDEMAKWHNLLLSMKESGKADPLYVANLNQEGTKMLAMIRHTMLRLQKSESKEKKMAQEDKLKLHQYQQKLKRMHDTSINKEEAYWKKEKAEEIKAKQEAKRLLEERSQEFAGEGSSAHDLAEDSAKMQEAARQSKLRALEHGRSEGKQLGSQATQAPVSGEEQQKLKQQKQEVHAAAAAKRNVLASKVAPPRPAEEQTSKKGVGAKQESSKKSSSSSVLKMLLAGSSAQSAHRVELAPWVKQQNFMTALKRQTQAIKQL